MSFKNTTETELPMDLIVKYGFYIGFGFILFATNLLIVAVILWFNVLRQRKEFIIIAGTIRYSSILLLGAAMSFLCILSSPSMSAKKN